MWVNAVRIVEVSLKEFLKVLKVFLKLSLGLLKL